MKKIRRLDWAAVLVAAGFAVGCGGGGCGGCDAMEPIPGGFPAAERVPNAAQIRVSQSALARIAADPAGIIAPLVGNAMNGVIEFDIPASCGSDPTVCCQGGTPSATCGPLEIDLVQRTNDAPRLALTPVAGASRLDLTLRARVRTRTNLPVRYSGIDCNVGLNTSNGSTPDLRIDVQLQFAQDPTAGTTRIVANNVSVTQLEDEDISLSGNFLCSLGGAFVGSFTGTLQDQIADTLQDTLNESTCKTCDSGQVAECGSAFATACTNKTCMAAPDRCLQELGLSGRLRGSSAFGGFSPGTTGALDVYEVAGGYATTESGGLALGFLGGMLPGGAARDRCGPSAAAPAPASVPASAFFQGNVRPDTGAAFDVAIGVHQSQLGQFGWAGYEGGLLCLTVSNSTVEQLSTDTLSLLSRSLGTLVEANAPMAIGLRPQAPPSIVLGNNTFADDGMGNVTLAEPLLDMRFDGLEIDFFASIDDQWVRTFTVVTDLHLPIGLQVAGMAEIVPVLGDVANAFTNVSVKNAEAVTESPADLAALFPTLLNLVLPQLSGGLGGFALPAVGGLTLSVTDITAVDNDQFLAIFADLVTTPAARPADTRATVAEIAEPAAEVARDPARWPSARPPSVTLALGDQPGLEWSYRVDGGAWSPWSTNPRPTLAPRLFWLPGKHTIDVRARERGRPETIDPLPERLEVVLGTDVALGNGKAIARNGFHGQAGEAGCSCAAGGDVTSAAPLSLALLLIVLPLGRLRRRARTLARGVHRLGPVVWLAAVMSLPGCSCGSEPCGDKECLPGEVANGGLGRFTSIAGDDDRVMVATYDHTLGDLVVADATDPASPTFVVVDGVPELTPTYEPSTYRGGIPEAGPDVGAWTSIAMSGGLAKVAYQDREATALKYAYETKPGAWKSYVLDPGAGEEVGPHASMTIDGSGRPVVAYLALGNDDGQGGRITELRLARAGVLAPEAETDWTTHVIARAHGTCAGRCGSGSACIAPSSAGQPELCLATTSDCPGTCGDDEACVMGACRAAIPAPTTMQLATGTGLFVSLVTLRDGRLAAAYYDRTRRALVLAVETAVDASAFTETVLDQATPGDRGMWASAVVDGSGVVHVAYQEALGDQLMYTTFDPTAGAPGTPEVVDDGQRAGDRPHSVGAAASIYLAGGAPAIAYHDGLTSDVYVATRAGAAWAVTGFATGPTLDGISIGVTTAHGGTPYYAWSSIVPAQLPVHQLVVRTP